MSAVRHHLNPRSRNRLDRALPLFSVRPVLLAIDHEHRNVDLAVALPRLVPVMGMANEIEEGVIVTGP
jgi:hypothetical protein